MKRGGARFTGAGMLAIPTGNLQRLKSGYTGLASDACIDAAIQSSLDGKGKGTRQLERKGLESTRTWGGESPIQHHVLCN